MDKEFQLILLFSLISFVLSLVLVPAVIKLANIRGWIVAPRNDRWHTKPTALMGGIAIFTSFCAVIIGSSIYFEINWMIIVSFILMFTTGLIDDLYELKPIYKLLAQILASFLILFEGFVFGNGELGFLGIPTTFLFVIGITNAINLLDNMDGLSAGISSIVAIVTGILAFQSGNYTITLFSFVLAGATVGFLFFNFKPAKIFMGDCGSLFLGFSLSFLTIGVQKSLGTGSVYIILVLPLAVMAMPILDTSLVTVKRWISGRKIYMGGRDHTSHRLVAIGLSEKKAVLILYGVTIAWGLSAILLINSHNSDLYLPVVAILLILTCFFGLFLGRVKVYEESEEKLAYLRSRGQYLEKTGFLLRFLLMNKKLIFGVSFDILVISASCFFSSILTNTFLTNINLVLGMMTTIKILTYFFFKSYRKSWTYISLPDINGYLISGFIASLISFILINNTPYIEMIEVEFFITDFILTFSGVIITRMIFKYFRETILRYRNFEKRILIYGAGEKGNLLCRYLLTTTNLNMRPVGFIDDDRSLQEIIFNAIPVLGGIDKIKEICNKTKVHEIIIASNKIPDNKVIIVKQELSNTGIKINRFQLGFEEILEN